MSSINQVLLLIVTIDAFAVLAFGVGAAIVILRDMNTEGLLSRIPGALVALVLSSLGCGVLLWGGNYMFGS